MEAEPAPGDPEETGGYGFFIKGGKMVAGLARSSGGAATRPGRATSRWRTPTRPREGEGGRRSASTSGRSTCPNEAGSIAMLRDPSGAFFCVVRAEPEPGRPARQRARHMELEQPADAGPEMAKDFYGKVFGWTADHNDEAPPDFIWMWQVEGQRWPEGIGGLMGMHRECPPRCRPTGRSTSSSRTPTRRSRRPRSSGGGLVFGPLDVPTGRMATLFDPQGAAVSILESNYPEPR